MVFQAADRERLEKIIKESLPMLCRNGVQYESTLKVQAMVGITVDSDVFLVTVEESFTESNDSVPQSEEPRSPPSSPSPSKRKRKMSNPQRGSHSSGESENGDLSTNGGKQRNLDQDHTNAASFSDNADMLPLDMHNVKQEVLDGEEPSSVYFAVKDEPEFMSGDCLGNVSLPGPSYATNNCFGSLSSDIKLPIVPQPLPGSLTQDFSLPPQSDPDTAQNDYDLLAFFLDLVQKKYESRNLQSLPPPHIESYDLTEDIDFMASDDDADLFNENDVFLIDAPQSKLIGESQTSGSVKTKQSRKNNVKTNISIKSEVPVRGRNAANKMTSSTNAENITPKKRKPVEKVCPKTPPSLQAFSTAQHGQSKAVATCSACGKEFKGHTQMKAHIEGFHNLNFKYVCKREGCGVKYRWASSLKRHRDNKGCFRKIKPGQSVMRVKQTVETNNNSLFAANLSQQSDLE